MKAFMSHYSKPIDIELNDWFASLLPHQEQAIAEARMILAETEFQGLYGQEVRDGICYRKDHPIINSILAEALENFLKD